MLPRYVWKTSALGEPYTTENFNHMLSSAAHCKVPDGKAWMIRQGRPQASNRNNILLLTQIFTHIYINLIVTPRCKGGGAGLSESISSISDRVDYKTTHIHLENLKQKHKYSLLLD